MRVPELKEIQKLANRHIKCTFEKCDAIRPRWKVLNLTCVGDPRKVLYVYGILRCKGCRVLNGIVVTCRKRGYAIKEISSRATRAGLEVPE